MRAKRLGVYPQLQRLEIWPKANHFQWWIRPGKELKQLSTDKK
jgi:hypothetical protein